MLEILGEPRGWSFKKKKAAKKKWDEMSDDAKKALVQEMTDHLAGKKLQSPQATSPTPEPTPKSPEDNDTANK